jgi:hypothetical protein
LVGVEPNTEARVIVVSNQERAMAAIVIAALALGPRPFAAQPAPTVPQAIARLQNQDFSGAAEILEEVTTNETENGRAWSLLGLAYRSMDRPDEAIAAYEQAVSLPNSGDVALFNLGLTLLLNGRAERGFELLGEARALGGVELTQIDINPGVEPFRDDPRYMALLPTTEQFADPFVEPARIIHEWRGESVNDQFGWIARDIGDVNGDGVHDVTTSAPSRSNSGAGAGRVYVYSGRDGDLLWTADGEPGDQLGLGLEAAGDVNADGVPDVFAGAPGADKAVVYSGEDGRVLLTLAARQPGELFGRKVSDIGDVNTDGHDDVLVGAPQNDAGGQDAGRVYIFSGATGAVLLTLNGEQTGDAFGSSAGGHVSEDGLVTIVVGAPNAGPGDRGAAVYHGLTTDPAFVIESDETGAQLGAMFVSAVGDVDGDGVVDVYASDFSANTTGPGSGRAYVHSGADGRLLYDFPGEAEGDGFGIGVSDAGDVDGDGHDDLLIGAWQHGSAAVSGGTVYLYSGKDGSLVREITGQVMGETWGFDTTGVGDVDGDGTIDFLVTSAWSAINGGRSGRMFIISGTR